MRISWQFLCCYCWIFVLKLPRAYGCCSFLLVSKRFMRTLYHYRCCDPQRQWLRSTRTHAHIQMQTHLCERVDLRTSANALTATWTTNKSKCKIYDEHSNCWRIAESFRCHTHTLCLLHGAHNYPANVVFTNAPTAGWQLFAVLLGMNFPIFHCENIAVESRCSPCPFWSFFV